MPHRITILQGHPDTSPERLCRALADAYRSGAEDGGFEVRSIDVAALSFPLIRSAEEFEHGEPPEAVREAQSMIRSSDHLVIVYPLWLGTMPALLKGFLEQVFRYDFAFEPQDGGGFEKKLRGRSVRVIVTMGMPALAYRWFYGAHSLRSLERNVLKFAGLRPVRETLLGGVGDAPAERRERWLARVEALGRAGR
jgi:putative NADPH-quinone reductase